MLQIRIAQGKDIGDLEDKVNGVLEDIKSDDVKNIEFVIPELTAVIEYIRSEEWKGRMCMDCQYWDDAGSADAVIGLCQVCGGKKRFNCKACEKFKDVRA